MESCIGCLTIVMNILPFVHYGWYARDPYTFNVLMLTTLSSCAREKRRATIIYVCTQMVELTLYTIILVSIMCDYLRMRFVIGRNDLNLLLLFTIHFTLFIFSKPLLIIGVTLPKIIGVTSRAPPDENRMAIKDDAPPSYESLGFPPKSDD
jgi:hypothetical protein